PPIGKSLWRRFVKDGPTRGIKAKTLYPPRPESWSDANGPWEPDKVFAQVQAGLLNGKSIGWLPTKAHFAEVKEAAKLNCHEGDLIVEEWLLIEYAVVGLPMNPETVTEIVSKSAPVPIGPIKFTPLAEIERVLTQRLQ